jgi:DegV family protein with EDD domain
MFKEMGVEVVPLNVMFGQQSFREGVDISADQFYTRMRQSAQLPTTSQPAMGDFYKVYEKLTANGDQVVSIHLSSKFSGTYNAAAQAAAMFPEGAVTAVDSNWVSAPLGFQVRDAVRAAQAGADVNGVVAAVRALEPKLHLYLIVETLENLRKGGRLSPLKAAIGGLLNVKPILMVKNGEVEPVEQPRSKKAAVRRLLEIVAADVPASKPLHGAFLHAQAPAELSEIERQVKERFNLVESISAEVGPTIGTHVGGGTVGFAYYTD